MSVDKLLGPHYGILIVRTNERAMRYEVAIVANCVGAVLLNSYLYDRWPLWSVRFTTLTLRSRLSSPDLGQQAALVEVPENVEEFPAQIAGRETRYALIAGLGFDDRDDLVEAHSRVIEDAISQNILYHPGTKCWIMMR